MNELIRFLKNYEVLIYIALGALAVWQIRKFLLAWEELRAAAFGLEKRSAQSRLNRSAGVLALLLVLTVAEYALVTFVTPTMPGLDPLPSPTIDLLASPTVTLPALTESLPEEDQNTPVPQETAPVTGCIPGEVLISFPEEGQQVSGIIEVMGTVDIPDFGFYKFEIAQSGAENWLTIQAGDVPKQEQELGFWDTTQLEAGEYQLRLVVIDNQGAERDPCTVTVQVEPPPPE